jgi:hypothetical protein
MTIRSAARLVLSLALLVLAVATARAQHPVIKPARALHQRIALADVVAVGTIGAIGEGRVEVRDAVVLRGAAAPAFAIKRNPAAPPPFVTGVPAVLLLAGARPPYVLVDEPREVVVPSDAAAAQRWTDALRALFDAERDPLRLLHTYLLWLDGDDETLREAAAAALSDAQAPYLPLGADDATARARAALDPRRAPAARRVSALLAISDPAGASVLVDGVPGDAADPQVVATALRGSPGLPQAQREAALLRALAHEERDVRRAALLAAPMIWTPAVAAKVSALGASDADPEVRADAKDVATRAGMP